MKRVLLIVLDGCGCGAAPDATEYGDTGCNTLARTAAAVGGVQLPNLAQLGLGNITEIQGVAAVDQPHGAFGKMREAGRGKDTTTGHWEIAGLLTSQPLATFPQGFGEQLLDAFATETGRGVLGNKVASGTAIIEELGAQHIATGQWIVYTSADSVFQLAAHEAVVPLSELYAACEVARRLCDPLNVGRVIARPFAGQPGSFARTYNRRDFAMLPPSCTVLDRLKHAGFPVIGVGKIHDIFCGRGLTESIHTAGNADAMQKTLACWNKLRSGLVFVNLIDFDSLYGHRRDPRGFAAALEAFDAFVPRLIASCTTQDLLLITADHGNDPTHTGTDHTREDVPLLAYGPKTAAGVQLGTRRGFFDVAATIADLFRIPQPNHGTSFAGDLR